MKDSTHEELAFEYANEGLEALYDRKLNKAALSLQAALNLFKEIGNVEEYAKNLNRIGVVYATIGNEAMAMDFFLEGLECAIANELHHISVLFYNNIGSRYMELNEYEKAIAYFDKAEKELAYEDMETRERYASWFLITKLNLMVSYKYLKQYNKAKDNLITLYLNLTSEFCKNNDSICESAKNDFSLLKESLNLSWDVIKNLAKSGTNKLKEWYEIFSGK